MTGEGGEEAVVRLHGAWHATKEEWFVAISWQASRGAVRGYRARWGIETSYRLLQQLRLSTTTNQVALQYLFVLVAAILLSLSVCVRASLLPPCFPPWVARHPAWQALALADPPPPPPPDDDGSSSSSSVTLYRLKKCLRQLLENGGKN